MIIKRRGLLINFFSYKIKFTLSPEAFLKNSLDVIKFTYEKINKDLRVKLDIR